MTMSPSKTPSSITVSEIYGQPRLWPQIAKTVSEIRPAISEFLKSLPSVDVILTGAGSSAFVAETVASNFERLTQRDCRAIATTDLVTHPQLHFRRRPTLLVSFARSGNSPESVAAVELADRFSEAYHLVVTCNAEGSLAKIPRSKKVFVLVLPEDANDKGLAMIGSVTGMMLALLLAVGPNDWLGRVAEFSARAEEFLRAQEAVVRALAAAPFERFIALGSGSLLYAAREAHLKVQELSNGRVMGQWDSFLGFRHGPRAVVDEKTLIVYLLSGDESVRRYETDLIASVAEVQKPLATWAITPATMQLPTHYTSTCNGTYPQEWLAIMALIPLQLLAAHKSAALGLNPDSPSPTGAIHRVVQGVTIYPYPVPS